MEFCPVCLLRGALPDAAESGESSAFEDTVKPTPDQPAQRFDHYELATSEDGTPVELGRGAMGITYKAFDVNLRCSVTLKVISGEVGAGNCDAGSRWIGRNSRTKSCPPGY